MGAMNDRWQYNVFEVTASTWSFGVKSEQMQQELNKLGQQGWELVTVRPMSTKVLFFMKRRA
jgi:hypothetical protein